jgi:hypothetical protein
MFNAYVAEANEAGHVVRELVIHEQQIKFDQLPAFVVWKLFESMMTKEIQKSGIGLFSWINDLRPFMASRGSFSVLHALHKNLLYIAFWQKAFEDRPMCAKQSLAQLARNRGRRRRLDSGGRN